MIKVTRRTFAKIIEGEKTIEVRAFKSKYRDVAKDDTITFSCIDPFTLKYRRINCIIDQINWYASTYELLIGENPKNIFGQDIQLAKGMEIIESVNDYAEVIPRFGIIAIHFHA